MKISVDNGRPVIYITVMRPIRPEALTGYSVASKISGLTDMIRARLPEIRVVRKSGAVLPTVSIGFGFKETPSLTSDPPMAQVVNLKPGRLADETADRYVRVTQSRNRPLQQISAADIVKTSFRSTVKIFTTPVLWIVRGVRDIGILKREVSAMSHSSRPKKPPKSSAAKRAGDLVIIDRTNQERYGRVIKYSPRAFETFIKQGYHSLVWERRLDLPPTNDIASLKGMKGLVIVHNFYPLYGVDQSQVRVLEGRFLDARPHSEGGITTVRVTFIEKETGHIIYIESPRFVFYRED